MSEFDGDSPIPDDMLALAQQLGYQEFADQIVTLRWIEAEKAIQVFVAGDSSGIEAFLAANDAGTDFAIVPADYSLAQLRSAREVLFATTPALASGQRLIGAAPEVDGSGLKLIVERADSAARQDTAAQERELTDLAGVPVTLETSEIPTDSSRFADSVPYKGGAYMSNSNGRSCTSGFIIGTLNAVNPQILSADHCSASTGTSWWSGNTQDTAHYLGYGQGQAPGGSDLERIEGTTNGLGAYVYVGAYSSNSVTPIRGWTNPIVGASVCYSGAPSGTVCNNTITTTNEYICYLSSPGSPCYDYLVRTVQQSGIPAAGNGDSGGPVIQPGGGGAYATGIVSGIVGGGDACTGLPSSDGRHCSTTVLYAPVSNFFYNNTNYGIYTAPPSGA